VWSFSRALWPKIAAHGPPATAHGAINPYFSLYTTCTRVQIVSLNPYNCTGGKNPRSACQNFKIRNFHNFLNFHQPKGCFLPDRQKSPEFYAMKNVKKNVNYKRAYFWKKEPIAVFLFFKKKSDSASQHHRPQKGKKKLILIFADFCIFGSACSMRF
jgi:hypothetical protein